jgi:hypothetical protein
MSLSFDKCVYRHITKDNNSVFYVGMGNNSRPYTKTKRSSYWKNIVDKHGYYVEVLAENLSFEDAIELEVFLISLYGRKDTKTGILCNLTDGGEGTKNVTESVRKKISERRKGIRNLPLDYVRSKTHCENLSLAKKGKESCFKNKKHTDATKEIIKQKRALQVFTKETLIKKSNAVKGGKNPAAVKVINIETKQIFNTMKEAAKSVNISDNYLRMLFNGKYKNKTNLIKLKDYESI